MDPYLHVTSTPNSTYKYSTSFNKQAKSITNQNFFKRRSLTSTSPIHQITRINIRHLTNKLNTLPTKKIFFQPVEPPSPIQLTPSTGLKIELKTQKWATDPKWAHFWGVLFCNPHFFHFLGAAAMRMGGPKPDKMYRVFKKVSSNSFF
jgi:hypothetical protein